MDTHNESHQKGDLEEIERKILLALKGIRYGSLEVIIHDSKIVQIERKEKLRFDRPR
ncbi:MAG: DUF2292 domain-containing protein [Nitrospiraceae bacterium]